ncbi:hypothetical protein CDL15_Pgr023975 [Punica granatum]|uniref:Uncharacterized protein n=1 Tax=Punica granatum TaxID=22663 RepID=A0A218WWM2_PUNGR|nr:hypothetical protein CDL15_Pgr023975 [Punica granatum]
MLLATAGYCGLLQIGNHYWSLSRMAAGRELLLLCGHCWLLLNGYRLLAGLLLAGSEWLCSLAAKWLKCTTALSR